ncbi:MAG: ATP-binding cassette domain-containing protein, partial [Betaproteobacteria bacterium]|nr:ATP-binding cassette domain-containing protein [Betaproteobacteria bacterium]
MQPGASLRAVAVTRRFGGITALDGVSLELRPGEVHGLIGPNGSGKTTLLNLLSGYYEPSEGAI